ncbi:hypothetical protein FKX85_19680 [Echinicola soli]|uniref:Uncharacterized protein n=1 Tax=Echinicola soli TaxID=2591634 RepID=A0A514CMW3_9BACT|nr:hypothetical protein [Echinicola soli]QDH81130.1 hypothetical protein FKX85_19680 [Echinicola soli]
MKRVILLAFCLVMGSTAMAQVGVGTEDPNTSSQLEVVSSDRGVLIPRVALEDITDGSTITEGNVESLLVFNITENDMIVPGYYYWFDGKWRRLAWSGGSAAANNMLVYDQEADRFYYNDNDGELVPMDLSALFNETVSSLENNGDGRFTYTDEQGNESMIDIPAVVATNISENGNVYDEIMQLLEDDFGNVTYNQADGTFSYIDDTGTEQVIDWSDFNTVNNSFTVENDSLTVTDSEGGKIQLSLEEVANNSAFVTTIANNSDFIDEITQLLEDDFGNVTYNQADGTFSYIDGTGTEQPIDWSDFNTVNNSFTVENDSLTVTDSEGGKIQLSLEEVANNSAFVTTITNNNDFIDEITQLLEEDFGNVTYNQADGTFSYIDDTGTEQPIDWSDFNTVNNSFTVENDSLTVTDSEGGKIQLSLEEVANNSAFVTTITNNNDFIDEITQLLEEDFGNVTYNQADGTFSYIDDTGTEQPIDWSDFNTVNTSFTVENDSLTVTDSEGDKVQLSLEEVANNSSFVTTIANNNDFIDEITQLLEEDFGNVTYNQADGTFSYIDDTGTEQPIDWSDFNTVNTSFTVENDSLTVTDSEGAKVQVSMDEIANNSRFITTLTSNSDFIEEIETIIAASSDELIDNGDGTFTHTAVDGTAVIIDANTTTVTDNGDGSYTFTDGSGTSLATVETSASTNGYDNTTSGLSSENVQDALDEIATELAGTTDELVDNGDGTFTHTAVDGTAVIIDANTTTVTDNGDGSYTFTDGSGTSLATVETSASTNGYDNTTSGLSSENVQDALDEIATELAGTTDELVDNGDGTFTHTAVDGTAVIIDANTTTVTDNGDGSYTFTDGSGTSLATVETSASTNGYDNTTSGLSSENVQDALDEIATELAGTTDELVDNGDGTFTHTAVDGTAVIIDANTTTVTDNGDGSYTFTDGSGTSLATVETSASTNGYDNTTSGLSSENVQDALDEIATELAGTTDELVDNGDGTFTHTAVDGTAVIIDANTTTVTDNGDGSYTFTDGSGTSLATVETSASTNGYDNTTSGLSSENVQDALDEIATELAGTTDELVDNGDGTFTHTAVDGTIEEIKATMPKFFYMPSIIFDTSVTGAFTRDLHQDYMDQFSGPMVSSPGAASAVPTLPATELEYHITYYDTDVFANVQLDANGVLTYEVIGNASPASFMNIVFVVK